jgi:hypothetical protein
LCFSFQPHSDHNHAAFIPDVGELTQLLDGTAFVHVLEGVFEKDPTATDSILTNTTLSKRDTTPGKRDDDELNLIGEDCEVRCIHDSNHPDLHPNPADCTVVIQTLSGEGTTEFVVPSRTLPLLNFPTAQLQHCTDKCSVGFWCEGEREHREHGACGGFVYNGGGTTVRYNYQEFAYKMKKARDNCFSVLSTTADPTLGMCFFEDDSGERTGVYIGFVCLFISTHMNIGETN